MNRMTVKRFALCALAIAPAFALSCIEPKRNEAWYRDRLAAQLRGGVEAVVPYGRADVTTAVYAIEVDFAHKFKEGIGQALWYAWCLDRKPGLALIAEPGDLDVIAVLNQIADKSDITLWVIDEGTGKAMLWGKR